MERVASRLDVCKQLVARGEGCLADVARDLHTIYVCVSAYLRLLLALVFVLFGQFFIGFRWHWCWLWRSSSGWCILSLSPWFALWCGWLRRFLIRFNAQFA